MIFSYLYLAHKEPPSNALGASATVPTPSAAAAAVKAPLPTRVLLINVAAVAPSFDRRAASACKRSSSDWLISFIGPCSP